MNHSSFRDLLLFDIGFAIDRNRALLRRLLKRHVADDTRQQLAMRVIEHLEMSGFKIDEGEKIMRKRDRGRGWWLAA
jgi:hypothetical protein